MGAAVKYVPAWEKIAVDMASKGFADIECCQAAGVSLEKLKSNLHFNEEFAQKFKEARAKAAPRLQW